MSLTSLLSLCNLVKNVFLTVQNLITVGFKGARLTVQRETEKPDMARVMLWSKNSWNYYYTYRSPDFN